MEERLEITGLSNAKHFARLDTWDDGGYTGEDQPQVLPAGVARDRSKEPARLAPWTWKGSGALRVRPRHLTMVYAGTRGARVFHRSVISSSLFGGWQQRERSQQTTGYRVGFETRRQWQP